MSGRRGKTIFCCQKCGHQSLQWLGRCPDCGQWDTFTEEQRIATSDAKGSLRSSGRQPVALDAVPVDEEPRISLGIDELDRVLGGGLVPGTLVLIGGDPGIGKSTLVLQALYGLANTGRKVLYVTGEESVRQVRLRSERLNAVSPHLLVVSEIHVDTILAMTEQEKPAMLVIDSIQTMFNSELTSAPGSVTQVRESTVKLMLAAKKNGVPILLVGHVTKDGAIAGPRVLEHMVDTVLYFEGDRNHMFRILRAVKNRFGSTNEIGVFEMKTEGLVPVANPSALFLSERPENAPGSVVTCSMEGTRPILVELQALASGTGFATPRRTILGLDPNRVALLAAVMEKRLGMPLMTHDIFMKVAGGMRIDEPAADLAIIGAVASSFLDRPVSETTVVFGEVGLTGEVRAVSHAEQRLAEALKMGFVRCLAPNSCLKQLKSNPHIEVVGIHSVSQAAEVLFD